MKLLTFLILLGLTLSVRMRTKKLRKWGSKKLGNGEKCKDNSDCLSNNCDWGNRVDECKANKDSREACSNDEECLSLQCNYKFKLFNWFGFYCK